MAPAPTRPAASARQPPLAALQRFAGNQAVAQLIAAPEAEAPADPKARVDQLQLAIKVEAFPRPTMRFDLDRAVEALTGLTREQGQAIKAEYKRRTGWTLGWVITGQQDFGDGTLATSLAKAEQTRLLNLLGGTVATPTDPGQAEAASALIGDVVSGAAALLGGDPASAAALGERAAGAASAASAASDQQRAATAEVSRYRADAAQVRRALERKQVEVAIGVIRRPFEERQALATQYATLYGESLYNALTTRLSGRDAQRAAAIWTDDDVTADRLALEGDLERQAKIEADTKGAEELVQAFPSVAEEIKSKRRAARAAVEARLEGIATAEQQDTASGRAAGREHLTRVLAGSTGSGATLDERVRATGDRVTSAIIDRGEPEELAARLARSDAEGKLTARDLEAALRQLRVLARKAAMREIEHQPAALAPQAANVLQILTDGYYQRFQDHFDKVATKRKLTEALTIGSDVEEARNRDLITEQGTLPPWRELDLALRRSPKDIDRVRQVLLGLTHREVTDLATEYHAKTKPQRSLEADLLGTDVEQRMMSFVDRDKAAADLAEKRVLLQGGTFESTSTDEATQLDEERRWLFGRFLALERAVIENRGTFAEVRDWVGNLERTLVDQAHADAADASSAMARALTDSPPDLAAARAGLVELRHATARIERNLATYKEATKAAFDEFVDLAVLAVTTIITAGQGTAVMMAIRTTIATIGTKAALKGSDYSLDEFLMDLRSGLGAAAGGKLVEGVLEPVAKQVAAYVGKTNLSKGFAGKVMPQLGKAGMWEAENLITTATGNVATGQDLTSGMGLGAHADNLIQEGVTGGIRGMRGGPSKGSHDTNERPPGTDERPTRTTSEEAGPVRTADTSTLGPVGAEGAAGVAERGPVTETGTTNADGTTTEPSVSMQLPEPARRSDRPRERMRHAREDATPRASGEQPIGDDTDVDIRTRKQQEQERLAAENPSDMTTVRETTAPDERAKALAREFAPIYETWHEMNAPERLEALERVVNPALREAGLPTVRVEFPTSDSALGGAQGGFSDETFKIYLDTEMVNTARTPAEFVAIADFVSHEARHALHIFRGMRAALAQGTFDPAGYNQDAVDAAREANSGQRPAEDMAKGRRTASPDEMDPAFAEALSMHQEMTSPEGKARQERHDEAVEEIQERHALITAELAATQPGTPAHAEASRRLEEVESEGTRLHNEYVSWAHETDAWRLGSSVRAALTEEFINRRIVSLRNARAQAEADGARGMARIKEREAKGHDTTRVRELVDDAIARERAAEEEIARLQGELETLRSVRRGAEAPATEVWPDPQDFDATEPQE